MPNRITPIYISTPLFCNNYQITPFLLWYSYRVSQALFRIVWERITKWSKGLQEYGHYSSIAVMSIPDPWNYELIFHRLPLAQSQHSHSEMKSLIFPPSFPKMQYSVIKKSRCIRRQPGPGFTIIYNFSKNHFFCNTEII